MFLHVPGLLSHSFSVRVVDSIPQWLVLVRVSRPDMFEEGIDLLKEEEASAGGVILF